MSTERLVTELQLSLTGIDEFLANIQRAKAELTSLGGPTPYATLPISTQQEIASQQPESSISQETLAAKQLAAKKYLKLMEDSAKALHEELAANLQSGASADKITKLSRQVEEAELRQLNASIRAATAKEAYEKAAREATPEYQKQLLQEKFNQEEIVRAQKQHAAAEKKIAAQREAELASMKSDAVAAYREQDKQDQQRLSQAQKDLARLTQAESEVRKAELVQMEAHARDAFSQLPSEFAVPRDELNALLRTPIRQPEDTDKVYRQREILAEAENKAAIAMDKYAEAIRKAEIGEGTSTTQLKDAVLQAANAQSAANRAVIDAELKLQRAIDTEAAAMAENTNTTFREDFLTGFKGQRGASYAEQIGQAAKFSIFYGTAYKALFMLTQTLQDTLKEGVAFEEAMANLSIAAGRPKEQLDDLAQQLSAQAVRAGFTPSQGIVVGAQSLGLYGATAAPAAQQNQIALMSSRVINEIAAGTHAPDGSRVSPEEIQQSVAAIAQAIGGGANSQQYIADLDAYMTKKFGSPQGATLPALETSATVGKAAGFTDQDLFAIAADLIARTGQPGATVGGYMAQIFTRGGQGSLTNIAQQYGIAPNQDLKTVLGELSKVYETAGPVQQAQIAAAFGRGKAQNAGVALLTDYGRVLDASGQAVQPGDKGAQGALDKQFQLHMQNLGGELETLRGDFGQFAQLLGQSGVLDLLGVGIITLKAFLESVNSLLSAWDRLPGIVKDLASTFLVLGGAAKAFGLKDWLTSTAGVSRSLALANLGSGAGADAATVAATAAATTRLSPQIERSLLMAGGLADQTRYADVLARQTAIQGAITAAPSVDRGLAMMNLTPVTQPFADTKVQALRTRQAALLEEQSAIIASDTGTEERSIAIRQELAKIEGQLGAAEAELVAAIGTRTASEAEVAAANDANVASTTASTGGGLLAAAGSGLAKIGKFLTNPVTIAIGGLLAIGAIKSSMDKMHAAQDAATQALLAGAGLNSKSTSSDFRSQASELKAQADANRAAAGGIVNTLTFGLLNNGADAMATAMQNESDRLNAVAARIDAQGQVGQSTDASFFSSLSSTDVATGLKDLTDSGGTAETALKQLRDILYSTAAAAAAAANAFKPGEFAAKNAGNLVDAGLTGFGKSGVIGYSFSNPGRSGVVRHDVNAADYQNQLATILTGKRLQDALPGALKSVGVTKEADLNDKTANQVAEKLAAPVVADFVKSLPPGVHANLAKIRAAITKAIAAKLLADVGAASGALSGTQAFSAVDATALAATDVQQSDARLQLLGTTDYRGQIGELRQRIKDLNTIQRRTPDQIPQIAEDLSQARAKLVDSQIAELEAMRKVAMQNAKSKAAINAAGAHFLHEEINRIVANGNGDQLVNLISQAGFDSIQMARSAINSAINVAKAALQMAGDMAQVGNDIGGVVQGMGAAFRGIEAQQKNAGPEARIASLNKMLKALDTAVAAGFKNKFDFAGMDVNNPNFPNGSKQAKQGDTAEEIAAAAATANADRSQGSMDAARAAIATARAAMDKAKRNSVAYYQALGSLYQAQNQLTTAIDAYQKNVLLEHADATNPLVVARINARAAATKLRQDIASGKAPDVIAQDRVDARAQQANAESTAFSQRLQAAQTADQLGRISHTAYLSYLQHEHDRLQAVKKRTYQQQQELDQIDGLMKSAAQQMQGQFNLGNIKLPTPYQVRRYIAESTGATARQQAGVTNNVQTNNFNFYGADIGQTKKVVKEHVGKGGRVTATSGRHR